MSVDHYTNDLSVRPTAEEARQYLTPLILEALDDRLNPLDDRFLAATFEAGKFPGSGQAHWWETRLPRVLVGELAEDVDRMGLRARQHVSAVMHWLPPLADIRQSLMDGQGGF